MLWKRQNWTAHSYLIVSSNFKNNTAGRSLLIFPTRVSRSALFLIFHLRWQPSGLPTWLGDWWWANRLPGHFTHPNREEIQANWANCLLADLGKRISDYLSQVALRWHRRVAEGEGRPPPAGRAPTVKRLKLMQNMPLIRAGCQEEPHPCQVAEESQTVWEKGRDCRGAGGGPSARSRCRGPGEPEPNPRALKPRGCLETPLSATGFSPKLVI